MRAAASGRLPATQLEISKVVHPERLLQLSEVPASDLHRLRRANHQHIRLGRCLLPPTARQGRLSSHGRAGLSLQVDPGSLPLLAGAHAL